MLFQPTPCFNQPRSPLSVLHYTEFRHFDIQTWTIKSIASFSSEKHSMITLNSLLVGRERCIGDVKEKN